MTRQDLEQVYTLKLELSDWQQRLSELQCDIAISPGNNDGLPHGTGISKPTEMKAIKLQEVSKIIDGKIAEIQLTIAEVEEYIMTIDDSFTRLILEKRCCRCKSWKTIARELGEGYTDEMVRQHYHRFVKNLSDK